MTVQRSGAVSALRPTATLCAMSDMNDFNQRIIDEFRANAGKVGGGFAGAPVVLLPTTGAKSGQTRVNPLVGQPRDDGTLYIFASKGGAPTNPDWYHNMVANPEVEVEFGTEHFAATATPVTGAERDRIYERQKELMPGFAEYEGRRRPRHPGGGADPQRGLSRRSAGIAGAQRAKRCQPNHMKPEHEDDPQRPGWVASCPTTSRRVGHRRGPQVGEPPQHQRHHADGAPHHVGDRADAHGTAPARGTGSGRASPAAAARDRG